MRLVTVPPELRPPPRAGQRHVSALAGRVLLAHGQSPPATLPSCIARLTAVAEQIRATVKGHGRTGYGDSPRREVPSAGQGQIADQIPDSTMAHHGQLESCPSA